MVPIKKTLVCHASTTIASSPWIKHKMLEHFDIELFDPEKVYDPQRDVMVTERYSVDSIECLDQFRQQGFKVVVEYFWDSFKDQVPEIHGQDLHIRARDWTWIHSHLQNHHEPQAPRTQSQTPSKFFLLLMNLSRDSRDQLFDQVQLYLDSSLYSYRGRGIAIDNDHPGTELVQTFFNESWYNTTNFSLVAETLPMPQHRLFVTEKTFKPIELMHPFVIYGSTGTLNYLHGLGFQTFDHIVDESYDLELTVEKRLQALGQVLDTLYKEFQQGKQLFGDAESQRRIQHNYNRFHDQSAVDQLWQSQVIDVMQEFVNG